MEVEDDDDDDYSPLVILLVEPPEPIFKRASSRDVLAVSCTVL